MTFSLIYEPLALHAAGSYPGAQFYVHSRHTVVLGTLTNVKERRWNALSLKSLVEEEPRLPLSASLERTTVSDILIGTGIRPYEHEILQDQTRELQSISTPTSQAIPSLDLPSSAAMVAEEVPQLRLPRALRLGPHIRLRLQRPPLIVALLLNMASAVALGKQPSGFLCVSCVLNND